MGRDLTALFREACGLTGPLRLDLSGRGEAEPLEFDRPFAVIGRDPRVDLVLDDKRVGRRHLYVQAIAGGIFWINIRARATTEEGAEPPLASGWLDGDNGVPLGPFAIRASRPGPADPLDDPLMVRSLDDAPLPEVVLEFPMHPNRPPWKVSRVLTLVGRGAECRLRMLDPAISTIHLALLRTPAGLWAIDLISREGIAVNGRPLRWGRLEPGDRLTVGPMEIRILKAPNALPGPRDAGSAPRPLEGPRRDLRLPALPERTPEPALVPRADLLEPMMAEMADRFDRMQERMFDRFEHAILAMAQMFGSLQREQMDRVREELARLDQLHRTLETLQAELATHAPDAGSPGPALADAVAAEVLVQIESRARADNGPAPVTPATAPQRSPAPPPAPVEVESAAADVGAETFADAKVGGAADDGVHALLMRRIAAIQRERQTRWQRVLGLVMGR